MQGLLQKGAVSKVPHSTQQTGFHSTCHSSEKSHHPVLDLRRLNRYLKVLPFKIIYTKIAMQSISAGEWSTSLDLKNAYFHVLIFPEHRPFFAVSGFANRPFTGTEDLYSGGLSCLSPPSVAGSHNPAISGRLVNLCPPSRSSNPRHRDGSGSCSVPGVHSELKKQSATGKLSWSPLQFCNNECTSESQRIDTREACDCSQGSETAGIDGRMKDEAARDTALNACPAPLEGQGLPSQRNPTGEPASQKISNHNGCITDRLGSSLGGQDSEGNVGAPLVIRT